MSSIVLSDYIHAREFTLSDRVFEHKAQFEIPYNQRPWSWNKKQLDALWSDVEKTLIAGFDPSSKPRWKERATLAGFPHFYGTFIVVQKEGQLYEVFDGQQRLTALCILATILRDYCDIFLSKRGRKREEVREVRRLHSSFQKWIESDERDRARIIPDVEFRTLFEALITKSIGEKERLKRLAALSLNFKIQPRHKKLYDGFYHLKSKVDQFVRGYKEADLVGFLHGAERTLTEHFCCVWVKIRKEPYAYRVFGCLNARGEKLGPADNIKNELFILADERLYPEIARRWRDMAKHIKLQDMGEFLRRRFIGLYCDCSKNDLFENVVRHEILPEKGPPADIDQLTNTWLKDAECLRDLLNGSNLKRPTKDLIDTIFVTLQVSLASIPLLCAARRYLPQNESDFRKVTEAILRFVFRELTVGKQKTPTIEKQLSRAARMISIDSKTPADLSNYLASVSSESRFITRFKSATEHRTKVQFYILYEIERYLASRGGMAPLAHSADQHVEHILPKNLAKEPRHGEWVWARSSPRRHRDLVNRLGNLLILEAEINKDVSNFEFSAKQTGLYPSRSKTVIEADGSNRVRGFYQMSKLKLVEELSDATKWPAWDEAAINRRQEELARLAALVWKI